MGPEADYKTFEVVEEDGRTVLRLHGTWSERAKIEADKVHLIMDAIAQGWDIDIRYADIEGDLYIGAIAEKVVTFTTLGFGDIMAKRGKTMGVERLIGGMDGLSD